MKGTGKIAVGFLTASLMLGTCSLAAAEAPRHKVDEGSTTVVHQDTGKASVESGTWTSVHLVHDLPAENPSAERLSAKTSVVAAMPVTPSQIQSMNLWDVEAKDTGGTLLFSDSPEYVQQDGILYSDTVAGDARVLYYHLNDSSTPKKVAVVLENTGDSAVKVQVTRGGMSQPGKNYLAVGKETQVEYFDTKLDDVLYLKAGSRRLLQQEMNTTVLNPGQLVNGVFDFSATGPVKVSVLMYPANANPLDFLSYASVLPKDSHRLRGTFAGMDRIIKSQKAYNPSRDGIVYFPIGDNVRDTYRTGIDATDGSLVVNYGNYGVLYHIEIPTEGNNLATQYYLSPLGGVYAGAMTVSVGQGDRQNLLLTPSDRTYFGLGSIAGTSILTRSTELANLGTYANQQSLHFEYSPPGASNLPVNIILMPASPRLAPNEKRR